MSAPDFDNLVKFITTVDDSINFYPPYDCSIEYNKEFNGVKDVKLHIYKDVDVKQFQIRMIRMRKEHVIENRVSVIKNNDSFDALNTMVIISNDTVTLLRNNKLYSVPNKYRLYGMYHNIPLIVKHQTFLIGTEVIFNQLWRAKLVRPDIMAFVRDHNEPKLELYNISKRKVIASVIPTPCEVKDCLMCIRSSPGKTTIFVNKNKVIFIYHPRIYYLYFNGNVKTRARLNSLGSTIGSVKKVGTLCTVECKDQPTWTFNIHPSFVTSCNVMIPITTDLVLLLNYRLQYVRKDGTIHDIHTSDNYQILSFNPETKVLYVAIFVQSEGYTEHKIYPKDNTLHINRNKKIVLAHSGIQADLVDKQNQVYEFKYNSGATITKSKCSPIDCLTSIFKLMKSKEDIAAITNILQPNFEWTQNITNIISEYL